MGSSVVCQGLCAKLRGLHDPSRNLSEAHSAWFPCCWWTIAMNQLPLKALKSFSTPCGFGPCSPANLLVRVAFTWSTLIFPLRLKSRIWICPILCVCKLLPYSLYRYTDIISSIHSLLHHPLKSSLLRWNTVHRMLLVNSSWYKFVPFKSLTSLLYSNLSLTTKTSLLVTSVFSLFLDISNASDFSIISLFIALKIKF